jgi:flagellar biosynthesis protein FliQ
LSIAGVLGAMTTVYDLIIGMFANVITTITNNPLIFVPVLIALLGGIVMFAIGVIRRLGVRGISSSGRRRGRRRR